MHKINQNFINCKGKQNKDIRYEKQLHINKPLMIQWVVHTIASCDVTNYKTKHRSLTKCGKTKIKLYLQPLP